MSSDSVNLLRDRIDTVESSTKETRDLLASHVIECAAIQKRVLVLSACILTWQITHSPEADKAASSILDVAKTVFGFFKTWGLL